MSSVRVNRGSAARKRPRGEAELRTRERNVSEVGREMNLLKQKIVELEVALEKSDMEKEKLRKLAESGGNAAAIVVAF